MYKHVNELVAAVVIVAAVFGMASVGGFKLPAWSEIFPDRHKVAAVYPAPEPPVAAPREVEPPKQESEPWCAGGEVVGGFCIYKPTK